MKYWKGNNITQMTGNNVFVFGSNPEGRHGLGAAKQAMKFGAKYGKGRGLSGNSYALPTKNLKAGYVEYTKNRDIHYPLAGVRSIPREEIVLNIRELYETAKEHKDKKFFIAYRADGKFLNGYTPLEMFNMFKEAGEIPENVLLHSSFRELTNN